MFDTFSLWMAYLIKSLLTPKWLPEKQVWGRVGWKTNICLWVQKQWSLQRLRLNPLHLVFCQTTSLNENYPSLTFLLDVTATISVRPRCVCQSPTLVPSSSPPLSLFLSPPPVCYEPVMRTRREGDCSVYLLPPRSCWYAAYYQHPQLFLGPDLF